MIYQQRELVKKHKQRTSWSEAFDLLPEANVALFSIPGEYGAPEMERALKMIYTCSLSRIMCQLKMKYV